MSTAPLPDFLSVNGTPDPRGPAPRLPESQLPPIPHIPGASDPLADLPQDFGKTEDTGTLDSVQVVHPGGPNSLDFLSLPEPGSQGGNNVPEPENGLDEISQAIGTLANANIQVAMPGDLIPAPHLEEDEDYRQLSPELKTFFRVLEKSGRVTKAAEISGVNRTSMYSLRRENPVIDRLWTNALKYRAELLEDEAIRRAINGVKEPVYYMGAVCGTKNVYSDSLLSKLLEGNMPEKYRQNHKIELEGKMAVATLVLPSTTSAEEWAAQNSGTIIEQAPEDEYAT